jgi:hypothetical protein
VAQDPLDDVRLLNHRHQAHLATAALAREDIEPEDVK